MQETYNRWTFWMYILRTKCIKDHKETMPPHDGQLKRINLEVSYNHEKIYLFPVSTIIYL